MKNQNQNQNQTLVDLLSSVDGIDFKQPTSTAESIKKLSLDTIVDVIGERPVLNMIALGIHRKISADAAKKAQVGTDAYEAETKDILDALSKGFNSVAERERANKAAVSTVSGKQPKFGRQEILGAIRDLIEPSDKKTLEKIKVVESYDETKFGLFVTTQGAKPDSLVAKALALLTERANEKAAKELEALTADLIDL